MSETPESGTERSPFKNPRPLSEVEERWIEECNNPEFRVVERPGWRDLYAVATRWDQDTGLPIKEDTWWHGRKGDFFSLWHAIIPFAELEYPSLISELVEMNSPSVDTKADHEERGSDE